MSQRLIRKISIGRDYVSNSMHYSLGQKVWDGHTIVEFEKTDDNDIVVWVEKEGELKPWKEFNKHMAVTVENDLNYDGSDEKERA